MEWVARLAFCSPVKRRKMQGNVGAELALYPLAERFYFGIRVVVSRNQ